MTEQIDLDALEALYRDDKKRPVGTIGQADVLALIAELRQERERAAGWASSSDAHASRATTAEVALSRAEETIEKALEVRRTSSLTSAEMVYKMFRVLTEYDKKKGASDD